MSVNIAELDGNGCLLSLANGADGQVLQMVNGVPKWTTLAITCEDIQDCAGTMFTAANGFTYNDAAGTVTYTLPATALNTHSINELSDVDTATSAPVTNKSTLIFDGSNWVPKTYQKYVTNAGAALPLATLADGGLVDSYYTDQIWRQKETNDIVPVNVAADASSAWYIRPSLTLVVSLNNIAQQRCPPSVRTPVVLNNPAINATVVNDGGMVTINATSATINVPGVWHVSASISEGLDIPNEEKWPATAFLEFAMITPTTNITAREFGDANQYDASNMQLHVDMTFRAAAGAVVSLTYAPFLFNFSRPCILRKLAFVRLSN
ncbi:MAG TPA: hypothetical protein P5282_05720 [Anaerolineaceae bacterium]|nr:hypothetical protein [Myxococcota bacterium]HRS74418.1 hypothetical protein [Anaerolineaceae bacterium]HRV17897.1 hypothetical protein [Myxococcota bacterium]